MHQRSLSLAIFFERPKVRRCQQQMAWTSKLLNKRAVICHTHTHTQNSGSFSRRHLPEVSYSRIAPETTYLGSKLLNHTAILVTVSMQTKTNRLALHESTSYIRNAAQRKLGKHTFLLDLSRPPRSLFLSADDGFCLASGTLEFDFLGSGFFGWGRCGTHKLGEGLKNKFN